MTQNKKQKPSPNVAQCGSHAVEIEDRMQSPEWLRPALEEDNLAVRSANCDHIEAKLLVRDRDLAICKLKVFCALVDFFGHVFA